MQSTPKLHHTIKASVAPLKAGKRMYNLRSKWLLLIAQKYSTHDPRTQPQ